MTVRTAIEVEAILLVEITDKTIQPNESTIFNILKDSFMEEIECKCLRWQLQSDYVRQRLNKKPRNMSDLKLVLNMMKSLKSSKRKINQTKNRNRVCHKVVF